MKSREKELLEENVYKLLCSNDLAGVRSAVQENRWLLDSDYGFSSSLLHLACRNDKPEMVELLLSLGADVNAHRDGYTPLEWGIGHISVDTVKILIRYHADLDYGSPLHGAYLGHPPKRDVAIELLKAGARFGGDHVLTWAVMQGDEEFVDLLVAKGFPANNRGNDGKLPLTWAACNSSDERHYRIAKNLLAHNADVNAKNEDGQTPLYWAVSAKFRNESTHDLATLYLDHGAKLDTSDKHGVTPLLYAAEDGDLAMIKLLVARASKSDLEHKDHHGNNLLHYAVMNHREGVCQYFIDKRIDCNAVNDKGKTPLHYACEYHHYDHVLALLKAGAMPNIKNQAGEAAIDVLKKDKSSGRSTTICACLVEMYDKIKLTKASQFSSSMWKSQTTIDTPVKSVEENQDNNKLNP